MTRLLTGLAMTFAIAVGVIVLAADSDRKKPDPPAIDAATEAPAAKKADKDDDARKKDKDETSGRGDRWMMFKLTSSQLIFAELTRGNLEEVAKHARASQTVDALEYWLRGKEFRQRSEYHKQLNQYQFAVRELARHAEDGNIDGALESWLDVSRSCVECHKLLRDPI